MEQEILNGGVIVIFAWLVINKVFDYLKSKKNGKNNQQEIDLAVIKEKILNYETNHFPTIDKKFEKNAQDHEEMSKQLTRIITLLEK